MILVRELYLICNIKLENCIVLSYVYRFNIAHDNHNMIIITFLGYSTPIE